ncbi:MAG: hypothetical protein JO091_10550 [Acidobacteriaceae bacterium]|nr:hypothetical protein [Acidobacteriaceae bacterium]
MPVMYFNRLADKIIGRSGGMDYVTRNSRAGTRLVVAFMALLATMSAMGARESESTMIVRIASPALAFARYIAFLNRRDVFTESGPVAVEIRASLPGQGAQAYWAAIRETEASERSEYDLLQLDGDQALVQKVVRPYLLVQAQAEELPLSSVLITPANYRFRYAGSRYRSGALAYVFQISPRKNDAGLIKGQLWIDSETGVPLRETGYYVKKPSGLLRRIYVTRDLNLFRGTPYERITYAVIDIPRPIRRAELIVAERPLKAEAGNDHPNWPDERNRP